MARTQRYFGARGKTSLRRSLVRPRWTREEITVLRRLYRTHSNAEIARVLRRKVSSVVFKGHRLGLSKGIRRLREMGRENIRRRWQPVKKRGPVIRARSGR